MTVTDHASRPSEGSAPRRGKLVPPGEGTVIGEDVFKLLSSESPHYDVNEFIVAPLAEGPGVHVHAAEDDAFYVLEGRVIFHIDGEEMLGAAGAFAFLPAGVAHNFRNPFDQPARLLNIHAPSGFDVRRRRRVEEQNRVRPR